MPLLKSVEAISVNVNTNTDSPSPYQTQTHFRLHSVNTLSFPDIEFFEGDSQCKQKAKPAALDHRSCCGADTTTNQKAPTRPATVSDPVFPPSPLSSSFPPPQPSQLTKADETGPSSAKRGVILIYDIFGEFIQTLRGADILATGYPSVSDQAGEFKVFMPIWFGDSPADLAMYPPKTPSQFEYIKNFMSGPANVNPPFPS